MQKAAEATLRVCQRFVIFSDGLLARQPTPPRSARRGRRGGNRRRQDEALGLRLPSVTGLPQLLNQCLKRFELRLGDEGPARVEAARPGVFRPARCGRGAKGNRGRLDPCLSAVLPCRQFLPAGGRGNDAAEAMAPNVLIFAPRVTSASGRYVPFAEPPVNGRLLRIAACSRTRRSTT